MTLISECPTCHAIDGLPAAVEVFCPVTLQPVMCVTFCLGCGEFLVVDVEAGGFRVMTLAEELDLPDAIHHVMKLARADVRRRRA